MRRIFISALIVLLNSSAVFADVLGDLAERNSIAGHFTQRVMSADGIALDSARGRFRLLRPDYFWWQIESPERQLLISVGNKLTQIDWDLEVVVEREITQEARSALQWLLAPRSELEGAFEIEHSDAGVVLTPLSNAAGFSSIALSHQDGEAWALSLTDYAGQVLEFSLFEDPEIAIDATAFEVPEIPF